MTDIMNSVDSERKLVNLGCGKHYHSDWINLDLVSEDPNVIQHDLRKSLPFDDQSVDAVYHSHVLEHLSLSDANAFLQECFRVLQPGGILRIAVPDLEQIARMYLDQLRQAWLEVPGADFRYQWMKLELIDQMTRSVSGGEMGKVMANCPDEHRAFLENRMGGEYRAFLDARDAKPQSADSAVVAKKTKGIARLSKKLRRVRDRLVRSVIKRCYGRKGLQRWDEACFRDQGEIHRWMHDRYSLKLMLEELGFVHVTVQTAEVSAIEDFGRYDLDALGGKPRKPDSLFLEAQRPAQSQALGRAA